MKGGWNTKCNNVAMIEVISRVACGWGGSGGRAPGPLSRVHSRIRMSRCLPRGGGAVSLQGEVQPCVGAEVAAPQKAPPRGFVILMLTRGTHCLGSGFSLNKACGALEGTGTEAGRQEELQDRR